MYQYASRQKVLVAKRLKDTEDEEEECLETSQDKVISTPKSSKKDSSEKTPLTSNKSGTSATCVEDVDEEGNEEEDDAVKLHTQIEEIDKRGKVLFKAKKYLEASEVFSEAIDLINSKVTDVAKNSNMKRQMVTLMNNRSAMYEKGDLADLALVDCEAILDLDPGHAKARTRKLRILEGMKRYNDALVEVCALQLKFMQENRDKLRMGIPCTPPVSQTKIEDLMGEILPQEVENTMKEINKKYGNEDRPFPSVHTIMQLLQSFAGYNSWMAAAAKDGNLEKLTNEVDNAANDSEKVSALMKRGRRYAYHRQFDNCKEDFESANGICEKGGDDFVAMLEDDVYARVLEWTGMCRHLRYDLEGAIKCYEACSNIEPMNAEILVKRAGVKMDSGKLEESIELFDTALGIDPSAVDALLHRANLRMLEGNPAEAKKDLEKCLSLRPDHVFARLRLATVHMALNDVEAAKKCLEKAEETHPDLSEVHSYHGELLFALQEFADARVHFDRAIECDASNPTPYVNSALTLMNIPGPSGPPDIAEVIRLLEKAIEVDPQFHTAYVHLGQLKLSMASDLASAQEVVALYDKGLSYCRTAEELKDIVSMRILTLAQIQAAASLKMETLNMQ
jgi:import receptor subunit TOM70